MKAARSWSVVCSLWCAVFVLFAFSNVRAHENLSSSKIFVNKGTFTITLMNENEIVAVYPIAIGRGVPGWPSTPEGQFVVENKSTLNCGRHCSPYGTRFMGLSHTHVGIHGTNQPHKIGTPASHGCIRMFNQDVEVLFEKVPVGTPVHILTKKAVPLTVKHHDKSIVLKCLPLTPDTVNYCAVKSLVFLAGGDFQRGDDEVSRVIVPRGKPAVTFFLGKKEAVDVSGNVMLLSAPPLYHGGEFYANIDDVLMLFHLQSNIQAGNSSVVATLLPYFPSMQKEQLDREDVPREPFTQMLTRK